MDTDDECEERWSTVKGLLLGAAAGYVLGTKAGRGRYEQIARSYGRIKNSPATKKIADVTRDKVAEALSTQPKLEPLEPLDAESTVYGPKGSRRD